MMVCVHRNLEITDDEDDVTTMDKIEGVIKTNFTGLVHVTRKAFHLMEKSNDFGMIINIGSVCASGVPRNGGSFNVYAGSKVKKMRRFETKFHKVFSACSSSHH
jgi:NAD(P)-dependent dehydrogenase (short-subunit alcohol dehydrogenase family)